MEKLIKRVQEQLKNNWSVETEDIKELVDFAINHNKQKIVYLDNGKWIDVNKLEFILREGGPFTEYEYYKTQKGNIIKHFKGMYVADNPPKFWELIDGKEAERFKKYINPNPENEL